MRLAAGLEAAIGLRASFSLEAGADLLWGEAQGLDGTILPYASSQLALGLGGGFDFDAGFRTSFDFETPADGYADWTIEGRTGIGYAATQSLRIEAAIFASATRSVGFDVEHKSQFGAEISAQAELGAGITGRAGISHTRTSGLRPEYDETRLALTLAAAI